LRNIKEKIETPESAICFAELTPANVFTLCPFFLTIAVTIDNVEYSQSDKRAIAEQTNQKVSDMLDAMNSFADHLNAEVDSESDTNLETLHEDNPKYYWHFIQGTKIKLEYPSTFELDLFDSYNGIFW